MGLPDPAVATAMIAATSTAAPPSRNAASHSAGITATPRAMIGQFTPRTTTVAAPSR